MFAEDYDVIISTNVSEALERHAYKGYNLLKGPNVQKSSQVLNRPKQRYVVWLGYKTLQTYTFSIELNGRRSQDWPARPREGTFLLGKFFRKRSQGL